MIFASRVPPNQAWQRTIGSLAPLGRPLAAERQVVSRTERVACLRLGDLYCS